MKIWTIGHSNLLLEELVDNLKRHGIKAVVDVRSSPYSKFAPQFNKETLQRYIDQSEMRYIYLGRELGGRPEGAEFYDPNGYVLYDKYRETDLFKSGAATLLELAGEYPTAIICSEENPTGCHRRLMIGRGLIEDGVEVLHIRADGRVQTDEELETESKNAAEAPQLALFDSQETLVWKSTRSVSRRRAPSSSSRH